VTVAVRVIVVGAVTVVALLARETAGGYGSVASGIVCPFTTRPTIVCSSDEERTNRA